MRRGTRGFTLLEIAVALAVLGVGVVALFEVFSSSMRLQDRAARQSRAVLYARGVMDALLFQQSIADHVEERDTADGFHARIEVRHAGAEEGLEDRELSFESEYSLRYLQVDVSWQDGSGTKTYTVSNLRRTTGGFTLLEVTLAMTALGMIAAMCYAAFNLGIRAVERGEVAVVTAQRLRVAADVLNRHMKSIIKYPAVDEDDEPFLYCRGNATSWTFVTSVGQHGGGGLTRVVYQVLEDPPRLAMSETDMFTPVSLGMEPVDAATANPTILLDGFTALHFDYMLDDGTGQTEWLTEWDCREEDSLPSAVRVWVDGLPGMDTDESGATLPWVQEMPVMLAVFDPENLEETDDFADFGNLTQNGQAGHDGEDGGNDDAGDAGDDE